MKYGNFPVRTADIRLGQDVVFDAWLYSMMIDNNLAYSMNPQIVAGPGQMAFMVHLEPDGVYLPCSDATFVMLVDPRQRDALQRQYNRAWRIVVRLVRSIETDRLERVRLLQFCRYRYVQYIRQQTLIPSRLVKRMTDLALAKGHTLDDPWLHHRRASTKLQQEMLAYPEIRDGLEAMPRRPLPPSMSRARLLLDNVQLARFMCLSIMARDWLEQRPGAAEVTRTMEFMENRALPVIERWQQSYGCTATVLFLSDADGGTIFDLALAHHLIRMGHKVIFAVKSGFHFFAPTIDDMENDPVIGQWLRRGIVLRGQSVGKNELLKSLREHHLVVIGDGTRERLNLYRVSVMFSRAWKEADIILCKGWRSVDVLLGTTHAFTRDIVCYWRDATDFQIQMRTRAAGVRKISEADIVAQADAIIDTMREQRAKGMSVMFYSCIIGSIPGETPTAIEVAKTFVEYLRGREEKLFVINPAEHFVEGMDGDDLMYMWERVQRSGFIDVWRFQTMEDVERSFSLMDRKMPPVWFGKDATYSTGCTKEMRIAQEVQAGNREMQIIGPDPRKFTRRGEYGVGGYFDATITRVKRAPAK
ncbi:MAG: hypothetical protein LBR22_01385 [Desulfovibrio sp.]|jgi:hypothetical protein|nr:hypothetical protein [Desulfovibrio sp.]